MTLSLPMQDVAYYHSELGGCLVDYVSCSPDTGEVYYGTGWHSNILDIYTPLVLIQSKF